MDGRGAFPLGFLLYGIGVLLLLSLPVFSPLTGLHTRAALKLMGYWGAAACALWLVRLAFKWPLRGWAARCDKRVCVGADGIYICTRPPPREIGWDALYDVVYEDRSVLIDVRAGTGPPLYLGQIADANSFDAFRAEIMARRPAAREPSVPVAP